MAQFKLLWAVLLILSGVFLGVFGRKLWKGSVLLVTAFTVSNTFMLGYYFLAYSTDSATWYVWLIEVFAILVGLALGVLLTHFARVGAALVAAVAGFLLGILVNSTVLSLVTNQIVFWIVCSVFCVTVVLSSFVFFNVSFLFSTSFVGSYFFSRGISLFAGGYPNEFILISNAEAGIFEH